MLSELRFPADRVVVSAMAGVSVATLEALVAPATDIARVIPLPSVARRDGITPVHPPNATAAALFDRLGEAVELAGVEAFEAFSASTATVAAHFAYLNTIAGVARGAGDPRARRDALRRGDVRRARRGDAQRGRFEQLAREHATAGGINEQFLRELTEHGTLEHVDLGLDASWSASHP